MTYAQKQRIARLRGEGASYAQIGAQLGLSENTVKSYGRRNQLDAAVTMAQNSTGIVSACEHCGQPMALSGQRTKRFCSNACRSAWWKEHPEALDRKAIYKFTCSYCGAAFDCYGNNHRKYCSRGCYAKAKTILARPMEVCS